MRRSAQEIQNREEIDRILSGAQVCRLGLCLDNRPYIVPVNFGYDGKRIYFHTAVEGSKIEMMNGNPLVCFEVEEDVRIVPDEVNACGWACAYTSVIGWGTVTEITAAEEKQTALNHLMRQYSARGDWSFDASSMARARVWQITIETVTGKHSKNRINQ